MVLLVWTVKTGWTFLVPVVPVGLFSVYTGIGAVTPLATMARGSIDEIDLVALVGIPLFGGVLFGVWSLALDVLGGYSFSSALATVGGAEISVAFIATLLGIAALVINGTVSKDDYQQEEWLEIMESGTVDTGEVLEDSRGDEIGKSGEVMRCPNCMEWDTYPRSRAASKGGGYYPKTCTHCDHEYEFESAAETREIIKDHQPDESWKKLYFGEHVTRYRETGRAYIDDSISGIDFEDESLYEPPKILLRKTGFGFNAFVDYSDARCLQVVYVFRLGDDRDEPFDQYDLEYFLGLLNSRVMLYYYTKERSEIEWQSYPYKTQGLVMGLPFPEVDFGDDDEVEKYERFVELVRGACESSGEIDREDDWEIERLAYEFYGIPSEKRNRVTNELQELQRLQVVRELFPDGDE